MTLSRRFVGLLIAMLLLTGALVIRSAGTGVQSDPCRNPQELKKLGEVANTREVFEGLRQYSTRRRQWTGGRVGTGSPEDPRMTVRIVRDFELFTLWLHPRQGQERFVPDEEQFEWIDTQAGPLPVHLLYKLTGPRPRLIAYAYIYGSEPTANPLWPAIRGAPRAVVEGTPPLTMLLASGATYQGRLPLLKGAEFRWLAAAYERYREVCGP